MCQVISAPVALHMSLMKVQSVVLTKMAHKEDQDLR